MPELFTLFPTPISRTPLSKHLEFKKKMVPKILKKFKKEPDKKAAWAGFCNTWQFDIEPKDIEYIRDELDTAVQQYLDLCNTGRFPYEIQGWFNVHTSMMYQESHNHVPALLSGIYYLQFDEDKDSQVIFENPNSEFDTLMKAQGIFFGNPMLAKNSSDLDTFIIKEGDLLLFPGTLNHIVPKAKQQHDQPRITFSFNINRTSVHPSGDA